MEWTEAMECFPVPQEVILGLYQLACTPFDRDHFEDVWAEHNWKPVKGTEEGWEEVPPEPEWDYIPVRIGIDPNLVFQVFPMGRAIHGVWLPVCYNCDYALPEERDAAYVRARDATLDLLGNPIRQDVDQYGDVYHYSIWSGTKGLLIVGQDDFEFSAMGAVAYWLLPWSDEDRLPDADFYPWLERRLCDRLAE